SLLVDVELGGNLVSPKGEIERDRVLGRHAAVLVGVEEEGGRRLRGDASLARHRLDELRRGGIAEQVPKRASVRVALDEADHGIAQDREIRSRADALDGIRRALSALLELRRGRRGEVAARREAENADPLRIDLPFVRARPNEPDRSTSILERRRV